MAYEHRLKVRYGETDQMGVVHHANYLLYLEEARTEYMAHLGCPYALVEESGVGLPVRRVELRHRAPAFYPEELVVEVVVSRVRAASVSFGYEVSRAADGTALASATVELACVDLAGGTRRPRMLPDELRRLLRCAVQADSPPPSKPE